MHPPHKTAIKMDNSQRDDGNPGGAAGRDTRRPSEPAARAGGGGRPWRQLAAETTRIRTVAPPNPQRPPRPDQGCGVGSRGAKNGGRGPWRRKPRQIEEDLPRLEHGFGGQASNVRSTKELCSMAQCSCSTNPYVSPHEGPMLSPLAAGPRTTTLLHPDVPARLGGDRPRAVPRGFRQHGTPIFPLGHSSSSSGGGGGGSRSRMEQGACRNFLHHGDGTPGKPRSLILRRTLPS